MGKKTKLIQVEIKGRSGFSGKPVLFKRYIKPKEFSKIKKETKQMGKQYGVKKTGKTKTTKLGFLYD